MPGMILRRPFFIFAWSPHQNVMSHSADNFFQPRRSSAQPCTQIQMLLYRKRELKLPFKPDGWLFHGCWRMIAYTRCPGERKGRNFVTDLPLPRTQDEPDQRREFRLAIKISDGP